MLHALRKKIKGYTSSSECETISFFEENTHIPAHAGVPLFPQSFHEGETGTLRAGIASVLKSKRIPDHTVYLIFLQTLCQAYHKRGRKASKNADFPENSGPRLQSSGKCAKITHGYQHQQIGINSKRSDGESTRTDHGKERSFTG